MKLLMLAALLSYDYSSGVSLHTEARAESRVVSDRFVVVSWVVEYSGADKQGNIHRWREEVIADVSAGELTVIQKANETLVNRLMSDDEQAHGFMRAVQGGQHD